MPNLPTDIAFWIAIPGAFIVLLFAWMMYIGRGKRATRFTLSGLGISISVDSQDKTPESAPERLKEGE